MNRHHCKPNHFIRSQRDLPDKNSIKEIVILRRKFTSILQRRILLQQKVLTVRIVKKSNDYDSARRKDFPNRQYQRGFLPCSVIH